MSTEIYHETEEMSTLSDREFITHSLRVLPAIIGSIQEAGMEVLSVDVSVAGQRYARVHIYHSSIPLLMEWALLRVIHPEIRPHGDDEQVVYTVDGIEVFALLTEEDRERYFPV